MKTLSKTLPYCKCGVQISRKEYTRCKPCFARQRKGSFVKEDVKYYAVHRWIRVNYGSASKCESETCPKDSGFFEWSLLKGKVYERKRENFWELCKRCHNLYDRVYDNRQRNEQGLFI